MAVLPTPASPTYNGLFLAAAAQNLDGALDLELAPDERVDLPLARRLVQIRGVLLEGTTAPLAVALGIAGRTAVFALAALLPAGLG